MSTTWSESEPITPEQIKALMEAMGFDNQTKFADVFEVTQQYVNRLLNGKQQVSNGPMRVLLRWLFAEYGIDGGRPPVPSIRVPQR